MRIKNVLVFSFSHIGDVVLSTAVISLLQKHFLDARISFLVGPKAWEVLWGDVRISELIIYDNHARHAGFAGKLRLIRELRDKEFDLVIDLRDSFWSHFVGGDRWGMQMSQRLAHRYKAMHAVDRYKEILRANGISDIDSAPEIFLLPIEKQEAISFLSRNGVTGHDMVVGIHPGGGWLYKLWPAKRFAALGDFLAQKYGAKVLLFAGPDETALQNQVSQLMRSSPIIVRGVGLRELSALIQRCHLYIGNDTGPMHIASAVGTRVVSIFGPTDPNRSGPYGDGHIVIRKDVGCNPCHPGKRAGGCKRESCLAMTAVSLNQVISVVGRVLDEERRLHTPC